MLHIRLLGQFELRRDDNLLVLHSRAAQSLLAFLLLNAGTAHRRERLAGLLWPNLPEENARNNLRRELWRLRKAIQAEGYLLSDDISVTFDAHSAYWLDTAVLEQESGLTDDLMSALAVYHGELLPGFYDDWVLLERERLRALFEKKMVRLLDCLEAEQRWAELQEWAERWIALGYSPEPAYRALMVAHGALGNRSQVAVVFERCVTALKTDLGVAPSEQTRALYERLSKSEVRGMKDELVSRSGLSSSILHPSAFDDAPPYKGLHYFNEDDADLFFGRERLVDLLVKHLAKHHWLTVVGVSGSGKSSLVRAGLVPALKKASQAWTIHILTPTAHPLEALAIQLTRGTESVTATTTLIDDLARDARALRIHCGKSIGATNRLLLVIDQFEELFTLCRDERERQRFIDNLLLATAPELDQPIYVVVALRADFYTQCAAYANLREALSQRQEFIGPMTVEEMRRAIEEPAARGKWELEPGLVDLILRDVGDEPGALPLLSHALLETWKRRRGRTLTLKGYAESGGVRGAIAQTAETVFHQLTPEGQQIARHIFLQLTELGEGTQDTRRRVGLDELTIPGQDASEVRAVLNTLAEARLVTLGEDTAEVAHEALIREWSRLREWLNQDREALRLHRQLTVAAQAWEKMNQDPGELYRGLRLVQAREWAKTWASELNSLEYEFLDASTAQQEREDAEREAQRQRELETAQRLAEAERQRAEAERSQAEAEARRADAEKGRAEEQARANRKLRQRAFLLAGALLVAAVLAVAAAVSGEQASQNATRAENERRIAFARELSVNAVNNLAIDPERSILLALQAVAVSTANGKPVLHEAEEALHQAVDTSRVLLTLRGHSAGVLDLAYSPDGKRLATASSDQTAKVWDAVTGKELLTLRGHTDQVWGIAYSPDGNRLVTSSADKTAKVWDAETGKELLTLCCHGDWVHGIAFNPDGMRIATGSLDKTVKVWDAVTGRELLTLPAIGGVTNVAFSPDGKLLAAASLADDPEHAARIWDAQTGQLLLTLKGHTGLIYDVTFSPDGKRVATAGVGGAARIWDSASGQILMTLVPDASPSAVAFSPDGKLLATGSDKSTQVWDAVTGRSLLSLAGHTGLPTRVAFNADGSRLATSSVDGTAKVWDITPTGSHELMTLASPTGGALYIAYSPDGTRLATINRDRTVKIWDVQTGQVRLTLSGYAGDVRDLAFSPDGRRLATTSLDQTIRVWDAVTGKQLLALSVPAAAVAAGPAVTFSPDSQRIASPAEGATIKVWDAETGQVLQTLCCHTAGSYARGVGFSPDGMRLATSGTDNLGKVWDLATGKDLLTLSGHTGIIWVAKYSPDGKWIVTGSNDGTAKIWDATTGKLLFTLSGHTSTVHWATFSPDGTRVATISNDGTVKVWNVSTPDAASEQPLTLYLPNGASGSGVAFSPEGKRIAASAGDGAVRIYALPLEDIVSIAQARLTRTLTTDECRKYLHVGQCPP